MVPSSTQQSRTTHTSAAKSRGMTQKAASGGRWGEGQHRRHRGGMVKSRAKDLLKERLEGYREAYHNRFTTRILLITIKTIYSQWCRRCQKLLQRSRILGNLYKWLDQRGFCTNFYDWAHNKRAERPTSLSAQKLQPQKRDYSTLSAFSLDCADSASAAARCAPASSTATERLRERRTPFFFPPSPLF